MCVLFKGALVLQNPDRGETPFQQLSSRSIEKLFSQKGKRARWEKTATGSVKTKHLLHLAEFADPAFCRCAQTQLQDSLR